MGIICLPKNHISEKNCFFSKSTLRVTYFPPYKVLASFLSAWHSLSEEIWAEINILIYI